MSVLRLRFTGHRGASPRNRIATVAKLAERIRPRNCFLIVDECHKAASEKFRKIFSISSTASLGLSATPERPYDDGLTEVPVPSIGEVIYTYDYADALRDNVIVPFELRNILFDLEPDTQALYDKATKAIAKSISASRADSEQTIALFLKRARILNSSLNRIKLTLKIVAANSGKKILIFHEDINACEVIFGVLQSHHVPVGIYHSKMPLRERAEVLKSYRSGMIEVLVTCRALDEGFNVPETEIGIIAASTATRRQRIQRLGRVVRPAPGKTGAAIYTLVASGPEISRLQEEENDIDGVASISWGKM